MMAISYGVPNKIVWLVVVCIVGSAAKAKADLSCTQVVGYLSPCISYVEYGGGVPADCCTGIRTLYNSAQTTPDRQAVCNCLKSAIRGISYSNFNLGNAAALPSKCQVNIPYKIDPSTNCSEVK